MCQRRLRETLGSVQLVASLLKVIARGTGLLSEPQGTHRIVLIFFRFLVESPSAAAAAVEDPLSHAALGHVSSYYTFVAVHTHKRNS